MNAPEKFLPLEATLIREKRIRMGLTQLELACLLELKENGERTIRGWELGEHKPSKSKLAKVLELHEEAPFRDENNNPTTIDDFSFIQLPLIESNDLVVESLVHNNLLPILITENYYVELENNLPIIRTFYRHINTTNFPSFFSNSPF